MCHKLISLKNEIMIVDIKEETMEDMIPEVTSAKIGDCINVEVLKSLGIGNFDVCVVCIGSNFQSSLEITSLLKEQGAKYVISKANRDIQAKFLLRNGADEVIYPDKDIADNLAVRISANHVFECIELTDEYAIYEIPPKNDWIGKTIKDVDCRATYNISIIGTKSGKKTSLLPSAEHEFKKNEHRMVIARKEDIDRMLKRLQLTENINKHPRYLQITVNN